MTKTEQERIVIDLLGRKYDVSEALECELISGPLGREVVATLQRAADYIREHRQPPPRTTQRVAGRKETR